MRRAGFRGFSTPGLAQDGARRGGRRGTPPREDVPKGHRTEAGGRVEVRPRAAVMWTTPPETPRLRGEEPPGTRGSALHATRRPPAMLPSLTWRERAVIPPAPAPNVPAPSTILDADLPEGLRLQATLWGRPRPLEVQRSPIVVEVAVALQEPLQEDHAPVRLPTFPEIQSALDHLRVAGSLFAIPVLAGAPDTEYPVPREAAAVQLTQAGTVPTPTTPRLVQ